jgi:hypothetical protein
MVQESVNKFVEMGAYSSCSAMTEIRLTVMDARQAVDFSIFLSVIMDKRTISLIVCMWV